MLLDALRLNPVVLCRAVCKSGYFVMVAASVTVGEGT
jgi:hypothetical protein